MSIRIPGVPFDPTEVGPFDVLRSSVDSVREFVSENAKVLVPTVAALVVAAWYFEVSLPRLPNWVMVGLLTLVIASGTAWSLGKKLARALYTPDTVLVSVQNATNGDQELVYLAPDRFAEMTVANHNGLERERGFLHTVIINGRQAFEVDSYDAETNHAVASWQAGVSNSQIRQDRSAIKRIKTSLEREADKALELLANHPEILRTQAREVSNRIVKVAEGVEVPQGGQLHERLGELLEESDPSEDLLDDRDEQEEQNQNKKQNPEREALGDIFERAAQSAQNGAEVPADD